jgi:hypothetical protein
VGLGLGSNFNLKKREGRAGDFSTVVRGRIQVRTDLILVSYNIAIDSYLLL